MYIYNQIQIFCKFFRNIDTVFDNSALILGRNNQMLCQSLEEFRLASNALSLIRTQECEAFYSIAQRNMDTTNISKLLANFAYNLTILHQKRFTSRSFLKISFSLYAPITSDECHAWFHLNAASPAARNTEHVNITKNCPQ